jgi:UDP-GlcNAc:undecaprenyl-phosphate GlcNAc-1-phosphate transferase
MGIFDDLNELSVREKLLFQFAAAASLMSAGLRTNIVFLPAWLNLLGSFLWIVCITNSFNLLDIADGLAAGIALTVCAGFLAIAQVNGDATSSVMVCILAGCLTGFLPYNLPSARAYMGNTGSHLIGFLLAAVSLNVGYARSMSQVLALASPLVILGFPLADTAFVALLRITHGKSALAKSKDHLALRMLKAGYSKNRMLAFMVLVSLFFALSGVGVCFLPPVFGFVFICGAIGATVLLTLRMSKVIIHA